MKGLRGRSEGESQLPRILRIKKLFLGIKLVCYRNEEIQDELSTCTSQTPQAECHRAEAELSTRHCSAWTQQRAQDSDQLLLHPLLLKQPPRAFTHQKRLCFVFWPLVGTCWRHPFQIWITRWKGFSDTDFQYISWHHAVLDVTSY